MKTYLTLAAAAGLLAGVTIANAQGTSQKQGGSPTDPPESGQSAERTQSGKTGGSSSNPSPNAMAPAGRTTGMGAPSDNKQGGVRSDPKESGGAEERSPNGAANGSSTNPSPR
jgi:hypothetical protein